MRSNCHSYTRPDSPDTLYGIAQQSTLWGTLVGRNRVKATYVELVEASCTSYKIAPPQMFNHAVVGEREDRRRR